MAKHTVQQGECISSIAFENGFLEDTIWNHPDNAALKQARKDPNILCPGDEVEIPDKDLRLESCSTDARHQFVKKGIPAVLRLQVFDGEEPRANQKYVLTVDAQTFTGTTDAQGKLEQKISPNATRGELTIGPDQYKYTLELGQLDPITEISGIQGRLNNLGYDCGPTDGELNERTKNAILDFQHRFQLPETGDPDAPTMDKLQALHDRVSKFPPPNNSPQGGK